MTRELFPAGHTVHMTLRHFNETLVDSVAECDCGWSNIVSWPGHDDEQDAAVEAHWRDVEKNPGAKFEDGRGKSLT